LWESNACSAFRNGQGHPVTNVDGRRILCQNTAGVAKRAGRKLPDCDGIGALDAWLVPGQRRHAWIERSATAHDHIDIVTLDMLGEPGRADQERRLEYLDLFAIRLVNANVELANTGILRNEHDRVGTFVATGTLHGHGSQTVDRDDPTANAKRKSLRHRARDAKSGKGTRTRPEGNRLACAKLAPRRPKDGFDQLEHVLRMTAKTCPARDGTRCEQEAVVKERDTARFGRGIESENERQGQYGQ
jgi:hypothetical protein